MAFTVDSPTRYTYIDSRKGPAAIHAAEAEVEAIARSVRVVVDGRVVVPEPAGYRITHVFQVADEGGEDKPLQYVESMDVDTWEHITSAIEVMLTRTRADGWTVSMTVVQLNLPGADIEASGMRQSTTSPAR